MMKKMMLTAMAIVAVLVSCSKDGAGSSDGDGDKTGSFSFDGKKVTGKVEVQYFGDRVRGNFSVLCQHEASDPMDPNFELLQVTFVNEKDATTNPALKIYTGGSSLPMTEPAPGIVAVSLSGVGSGLGSKEFTGTGKSTGSIAVKNRTITIKGLVLFNADGDKRTVDAVLPF